MGGMCFSARIQQDLHALARRFGASIDWPLFEELFRSRLEDSRITIPRALDAYVMKAQGEEARPSQAYIEQYRTNQAMVWEQELFKQRKRLVDAQRTLKVKETKKARTDERVATGKIAALTERLTTLRSDQIRSSDSRIFPKWYVPVVVNDGDRLLIRPLRYLCRLPGKPANYDERYKGTYNARRNNLNGFWSSVYGLNHGVIVADSFYENVPRHLYEKRELAVGEDEENMVLHFNPQPPNPMVIACVWSHWTGKEGPDLYSFAAVTDDPPPEILETGHTRCPISLKEENVREWLSPSQFSKPRLEEILSDHVEPYYEHRIAA
jgi:putative SOS response-associated peptidase YedK